MRNLIGVYLQLPPRKEGLGKCACFCFIRFDLNFSNLQDELLVCLVFGKWESTIYQLVGGATGERGCSRPLAEYSTLTHHWDFVFGSIVVWKRCLFVSDEAMEIRWPRCCVISGLVVAVIGAVLAATFPLAYQSILNYVSCISHPFNWSIVTWFWSWFWF